MQHHHPTQGKQQAPHSLTSSRTEQEVQPASGGHLAGNSSLLAWAAAAQTCVLDRSRAASDEAMMSDGGNSGSCPRMPVDDKFLRSAAGTEGTAGAQQTERHSRVFSGHSRRSKYGASSRTRRVLSAPCVACLLSQRSQVQQLAKDGPPSRHGLKVVCPGVVRVEQQR